jgi:hypothetical protein
MFTKDFLINSMFYILEELVTKDTPTNRVVEDLERRVENEMTEIKE